MITDESSPFEIGKAVWLRTGGDVAIIACGAMVYQALLAADQLANVNIQATVINLHTIKPLDRDSLIRAATACGCVVTAEEHQIAGGVGSAVAEALATACPIPVEFVGIHDTFGESGQPDELMEKYGLSAEVIVSAAKRALQRK